MTVAGLATRIEITDRRASRSKKAQGQAGRHPLSAALIDADALSEGRRVTSSAALVASIDEHGLVTARKKGKTTIRVRALDGGKAKAKLTAHGSVAIVSLSAGALPAILLAGGALACTKSSSSRMIRRSRVWSRGSWRRWGYEARPACDFRRVLDEFRSFGPHLTLMDISLPFCDGYHWCAEIRKVSRAPVIFLSSASDDMNVLMALNMGADDFIAKPFDLKLLMAKVQALIRRAYDFA